MKYTTCGKCQGQAMIEASVSPEFKIIKCLSPKCKKVVFIRDDGRIYEPALTIKNKKEKKNG